jgi:hypothetical protein
MLRSNTAQADAQAANAVALASNHFYVDWAPLCCGMNCGVGKRMFVPFILFSDR